MKAKTCQHKDIILQRSLQFFPLRETFSSVVVPVVVFATDVELAGMLLFIFSASSSGLEAAGAVLTLPPGLGSRLMTGMAEVEAVGRGAARRLLRVVVLVEEGSWMEVVAGGDTDFTGSGAKQGK